MKQYDLGSIPSWKILCGDVRDVLRLIPDNSIHCIITSPPYFGLRDYGLKPTIWGGKAGCKHKWGHRIRGSNRGGSGTPTDKNNRGEGYGRATVRGNWCKCKAWRGVYGLEPTPEMYIAHTVEIFSEIRRVLRKDGTLWLNLGDSYSNDTKWGGTSGGKNYTSALGGYQGQRLRRGKDVDPKRENKGQPISHGTSGLKPKDMMGMPWRVAFALQADGWWLRQEIIWEKPNAMPESVRDRCTTNHERIFLLAKSERYFFDGEAIKEPVTGGAHERGDGVNPRSRKVGRNSRELVNRDPAHNYERQNESWSAAVRFLVPTRSKRTVWTIATQPYAEAHFATFPEALVEPMILAGTSEKGCCAECGASWTRVVKPSGETKPVSGWDNGPGTHHELVGSYSNEYAGKTLQADAKSNQRRVLKSLKEARANGGDHDNPWPPKETIGWQPGCKCSAKTVPALVLDPFSGSGTVGVVATRQHRRFLGVDAKEEYCEMARSRISNDRPLFNTDQIPAGEEQMMLVM